MSFEIQVNEQGDTFSVPINEDEALSLETALRLAKAEHSDSEVLQTFADSIMNGEATAVVDDQQASLTAQGTVTNNSVIGAYGKGDLA